MAVKIVNGGTFPKEDGQRPGLYVRFIERAIAAIGTGARSKVATVFELSGVDTEAAETGKVYRITNMSEANTLFGYTKQIGYILQGGASEVVVATYGADAFGVEGDAGATVDEALQNLITYEFHVFVDTPLVTGTERRNRNSNIATWVQTAANEGKNFVTVYSDSAQEGNVEGLIASANYVADEKAIFVANSMVEVDAEHYAAYIAGLIAGQSLDGSITYDEVPFTEVKTRFRSTQVKELLAAGLLVTTMDGESPRIEQGLTLGKDQGEFNKIRTVNAKLAIADDIDKAVRDGYVGKITNNADGQIAVMNAIKTYLETLVNGNVINAGFTVELDPTNASVGAELYINIGVQFLDAIEYVYLTVTV